MSNPTTLSNNIIGKRRIRKSRWLRRGAVTVEMAMVAPVVFLMFFGSVEFARMMMVRQALTNAAREGCRNACLATTQNSDASEAVIRDALDAVIPDVSDSGPLEIEFEPSFESTPEPGTTITASIEVDCADISWLPPFFTAGAQIRGTASMTRE